MKFTPRHRVEPEDVTVVLTAFNFMVVLTVFRVLYLELLALVILVLALRQSRLCR